MPQGRDNTPSVTQRHGAKAPQGRVTCRIWNTVPTNAMTQRRIGEATALDGPKKCSQTLPYFAVKWVARRPELVARRAMGDTMCTRQLFAVCWWPMVPLGGGGGANDIGGVDLAVGNSAVGRGVLEGGGGRGGGGLKGGRGGFRRDPPPPRVPLWSLPKGGRKFLKLKSSWHRRRRSKILAVSHTHYKRRGEGGRGVQGEGGRGGGVRGGTPPPPTVYGRSNTSLAVGLRNSIGTAMADLVAGPEPYTADPTATHSQ